MKKTVPTSKSLLNLSSGLLVALFTLPAFSSSNGHAIIAKAEDPEKTNKTIVSRLYENKNYYIEMHSSPTLRQLLISAGPEQKKVYHFYLFDIDGKLKAEANIRRNSKTALVNISKGNYIFEIYHNDQRIENGQLKIE